MKKFFVFLGIIVMFGFVFINTVFGQGINVQDSVRIMNTKLSHSAFTDIDSNGFVEIKTPQDIIKFNIKDVVFNYNGANNDSRIRIMGDYCLAYYKNNRIRETSHRENFVCNSKKDALDIINILRKLKRHFISLDPQLKLLDKKINSTDPTARYTDVFDVLDVINDNLTYSGAVKVDQNGFLIMNGPENIYKIDLRKSEFSYKDLNDVANVRIYGDWGIQTLNGSGKGNEMTRESFQTESRISAYKVVKALYYIKGSFLGYDLAYVNTLKNVTGRKSLDYRTISEAVDFINDRLSLSIVMYINEKGWVTINAPSNIFRFNIVSCRFSLEDEGDSFWGHVKSMFRSGIMERESVEIKCSDGIKKYENRFDSHTLEEESFSCKSSYDAKEVIKAFEFIRDGIRSGKLKK